MELAVVGTPKPQGKLDVSEAGKEVTLDQMMAYTENCSVNIEGVYAHLFSVSIFRQVLDQEGAIAARLYYGEYNDKPTLVVVGVNPYGDNLLDGIIVEATFPCPPWC